VPLATELVAWPGLAPFLMRRLVSHTPKHLRAGGPKPNPFLPWDPRLEVSRLGDSHVVLLNKFPVEPGHVLVISQQWQPQSGWLSQQDWRAVAEVDGDTGGLWFFNSCAAAGASQPHRHLQLLPRRQGEPSCPLAPLIQAQLRGGQAWKWRYAISPRSQPGATADELAHLYGEHAGRLGLGDPRHDPQPRHPYNLLFNDHWLLTVLREREHCAGFSLNALGFAGYLLATDGSDLHWLRREGPWQLLRAVAAPAT
jgi:sulfate adenylyltransferase (ADP) / ATP adenylyltransferase